MTLLHPATLILILLSALGYAAATIGMKVGSGALTGISLALLVGGLACAIGSEMIVLKRGDLGPIYIAILGVETLVVLTYAWYIGEPVSLRQLGGAAMVLTGLVVVGH